MDQNNMQQPVEQPVVQPAPAAQPSKGKAIAAMVCGIIGVVGGLFLTATVIGPVITLVLSILGIILGSKGMKEAKITGVGKGMAVTGLVLGIIGTVFSAIGVICALACAATVGAANNALKDLEDLANMY